MGLEGDNQSRQSQRAQHDRRTILRRGTAATVAGVVGLSATSGTVAAGDLGGSNGDYTAPDDYPLITTRDHFNDDAELINGETEYSYDGGGDWAKYDESDHDELCIFVHGWNFSDENDADIDAAYTCELALEENGYDQLNVGYSWDSDTGDSLDAGWSDAQEIARRNGPKLAAFVYHWWSDGRRPIRIIAHSLGAQVIASAVQRLYEWGVDNAIESVSLLGGGIDDQSVQTNKAYGEAFEYAVYSVANFYKTDDEVLDTGYKYVEWDSAVGQYGIQDWDYTPYNYLEEDVTDTVVDHNSHYEPGDGSIPNVVDTF